MSQAKVDKYKEEKKNRKAQLEKQKKRKKMWKIIGPILALVIVAGIGAGIYYIPILTNQAASENSDVDMDELMELLNSSLSGNDVSGNDVTGTETDAANEAKGKAHADKCRIRSKIERNVKGRRQIIKSDD